MVRMLQLCKINFHFIVCVVRHCVCTALSLLDKRQNFGNFLVNTIANFEVGFVKIVAK